MKVSDCGNDAQSRITSFRYARGTATAVIETDRHGLVSAITVQLNGVSERDALALCQATARLRAGGVIMDGSDILAIRDSLDNARGLATELAPEHAAATLAIAAIEATRDRLAPVTSFDEAFAPAPAFLEGLAS